MVGVQKSGDELGMLEGSRLWKASSTQLRTLDLFPGRSGVSAGVFKHRSHTIRFFFWAMVG